MNIKCRVFQEDCIEMRYDIDKTRKLVVKFIKKIGDEQVISISEHLCQGTDYQFEVSVWYRTKDGKLPDVLSTVRRER